MDNKEDILREIDVIKSNPVSDDFPETMSSLDEFQHELKNQDIAMRQKILDAIHHEIESKKKLRKIIANIVGIYIAIITIYATILICLPQVDVKIKVVLATVILGNTIGIITYFCKYAFSDSEALINLFHKINSNLPDNEDN